MSPGTGSGPSWWSSLVHTPWLAPSSSGTSEHPVLFSSALEASLPNGQCQLTYAAFHLRWTIPLAVVLVWLARPFLTRLDRLKLLLLPCIALVWTTLWDSQLIRRGAWTYPRSCVLATVLYVPVEEYFFVSTYLRHTTKLWPAC